MSVLPATVMTLLIMFI